MSDTFDIEVTSDTRENFNRAMAIAHSNEPHPIVAVCNHPKYGLVLFWTYRPNETVEGVPVQALPFPWQTTEAIADFVWHWLMTEATYEDEPDHDGTNKKGFRVYRGRNPHGASIAIQPVWCIYSK